MDAIIRRFIPVGLVACLITGCSTAVYEDEIKEFQTSTGKAVDALRTYATEGRKSRAENDLRQKLLESPDGVLVTLSQGCHTTLTNGASDAPKCVVLLNDQVIGEKKSAPAEVAVLKLLGAISNYADNLGKLASADDIDKAKKAIEGLSGSVVSLASAMASDDDVKKKVTGTVGPVTAVFNWLAGNYLEYKRWVALKEATALVQPDLEAANTQLSDLSIVLRNDYANARLANFARVKNVIRISDGTDAVEKIIDVRGQAAAIAAVINSKPANMFDAMIKAHRELTAAIADPRRQAAAVFASLKDFKSAVDEIISGLEQKDAK